MGDQDHTSAILEFEMADPARRNAIDMRSVHLLEAAIDRAEKAGSVALTIRSTLSDVFCAGVDLTLTDRDRAAVSDRLYALYEKVVTTPVIIVAEVGGAAIGGGAQLCLAADICMVTADAWFRFVGAGHGLAVGPWALSSSIGRHRAAELCYSMRALPAAEAISIGLATPYRREMMSEIVATDAAARVRIKSLLNDSLVESLNRERVWNREAWDGSIAGLDKGEPPQH